MLAILRHPTPGTCPGLLPVAGRPLVARQLAWLRAAGVDRIAVCLGEGPCHAAIVDYLARREPTGRDVILVRTDRDLDDEALRRAAGFPDDAPVLVIPADVLGDGDPTALLRIAEAGTAVAQAFAPIGCQRRLEGAMVRVLGPARGRLAPRPCVAPGWLVRLRDHADALALGDALLRGGLPERGGAHAFPMQVHGAEVAPGVWIGRGAFVHPEARVIGPVWIGPGAHVAASARLGPGVHLGEGAVVESDVTLRECVVDPYTLVREGAEVKRGRLAIDGVFPLEGGAPHPSTARIVASAARELLLRELPTHVVGFLSAALASALRRRA